MMVFHGMLWDLPSGKLSHNHGKIHHFSWENSLCLWPFSMAMYRSILGSFILVTLREFTTMVKDLVMDAFPLRKLLNYHRLYPCTSRFIHIFHHQSPTLW